MSNNSTKLSKLLQNALDELNEELFLKKENKLSHNQSLIIKLFEKYEYRENNGDDDTDYQNAHIFIRDLLNNNSFGKKVKLRHLTRDCHKLLSRADQLVVDSDDDPDYGMAVDYGVKLGIFGK